MSMQYTVDYAAFVASDHVVRRPPPRPAAANVATVSK